MSDALPNLRHLRAFCEVERQRSLSRAAEAVFLSQPAVTQAVAKLERELGEALLERVGSGVVPTEAGRAYAYRVRRALGMIEAGLDATVHGRAGRDVLPLLTTTQLRAFVAVGTTNNFTLAAKLIASSQPAVHRSTRELEGILQLSLFEKTTRGILLTRAGQSLWQQLKIAFAELAQGVADVQACAGIRSGRIVVGCMPLARHFVMPEAISEFSRGGADIHIEVVESPYTDLLHRLRHGEIDFLIGALRYPQPVDDIVQEPLFSAALCVAAGKRHPLAARRNITLPDLAGFPWVLPLPGTPTRDRFARLMQEQAGVWQQGLVESSSQILIRGLLMNSDRLTLISRHQVQFEVDLGELVVLDYQISDSLRQIGLSFRGDWHPTVVQQEFLSVLRAVAARYSES